MADPDTLEALTAMIEAPRSRSLERIFTKCVTKWVCAHSFGHWFRYAHASGPAQGASFSAMAASHRTLDLRAFVKFCNDLSLQLTVNQVRAIQLPFYQA
jgi:hypothetical protein